MRLTETNYRSLYRASLVLKGLFALGELLLGLFLLFASQAAVYGALTAFTGDEFSERPLDLLARYATHGLQGFAGTPQGVWAAIFLSHGLIKLVLVGVLLKEKMWAYPAGIVVFGVFIAYQVLQMVRAPSAGLLFITLLDAAVIVLVAHEWRWKRRKRSKG